MAIDDSYKRRGPLESRVKTVAPLASNPAIQTQVAKQVSANLINQANVESRVKDALPPKAGFLAAPDS